MAINDPDEYAWQLFFFLNRPAKSGMAGEADPSGKFGEVNPNASLVWETWALASGQDSEVFLENGDTPPRDWDHLERPGKPRRLQLSVDLEQEWIEQLARKRSASASVPADRFAKTFPPLGDNKEVRVNRVTFKNIVAKNMFSKEGLEALRDTAIAKADRFYIQMDTGAKEIKAYWLPLPDECSKQKYLWRIGPDGKAYGLVAMHIATKDLPMWFWADFGHKDCETGDGACRAGGYQGLESKPVDRTTRGCRAKHGTDGVRNETRGTVWENYILRGTQTAFVNPMGGPTELSNPVIESTEPHSSCITCHAYASIGPPKSGLEYVDSHAQNRSAGIPCAPWFQPSPPNNCDYKPIDPSVFHYVQADFMWSTVLHAPPQEAENQLAIFDRPYISIPVLFSPHFSPY